MANELVKRKLKDEILPYIVAGRNLKKRWFVRAYLLYVYAHDSLAALSGISFSTPLLSFIKGLLPSTGLNEPTKATIDAATSGWVLVVGVIAVFGWSLLKLILVRGNAEKRAVLARSCSKQFLQIERSMREALSMADPMPELKRIYKESIMPLYDRNMQDDVFTDDPAGNPAISAEVDTLLDQLCKRYESNWTETKDENRLDKKG